MQALDQAQRGSGEGSEGFRGGLGGFGAQPGQVQQGSGEGSREGWEALAQSQVRFNRVPDQVQQEKVPGSLGANRVPEKVPGEPLGGFGGEPGQVQPEKVCRALRETGRYLRRRLQIGFRVQNQF